MKHAQSPSITAMGLFMRECAAGMYRLTQPDCTADSIKLFNRILQAESIGAFFTVRRSHLLKPQVEDTDGKIQAIRRVLFPQADDPPGHRLGYNLDTGVVSNLTEGTVCLSRLLANHKEFRKYLRTLPEDKAEALEQLSVIVFHYPVVLFNCWESNKHTD